MIAGWDIWKFRGEDMRLFREGEEIPDGWYDQPSKFNGANPAAFDHDLDGREGGSVSVKRKHGRPRKVQP